MAPNYDRYRLQTHLHGKIREVIIFRIIPIANFDQKFLFNSVHCVDRHLDREIHSPILHQPRFVALEKICVALQTLDASHQTLLQIPYVH